MTAKVQSGESSLEHLPIAPTAPVATFKPSQQRLCVPLTVIPLDERGWPRLSSHLTGNSTSISSMELSLVVDTDEEIGVGSELAVGSIREGQTPGFVALTVEHSITSPAGGQLLKGSFGGSLQTILDAEFITPSFQTARLQYVFCHDEATLQELAKAGILRRTVLEKIQICPQCGGLPSVSRGCADCGRTRLKTDQLIHHFACAYVGLVGEFESDGELVCPKCLTRKMVGGVDFEHLTGEHRCEDCQWSGPDTQIVGRCLQCRNRFSIEQAAVLEIPGYQANRIEIQILISKSTAESV